MSATVEAGTGAVRSTTVRPRAERARTATVTALLLTRRDSDGVKRKPLASRPPRAKIAARRGSAEAGVKEPMPRTNTALPRGTIRAVETSLAPSAGATATPRTTSDPNAIPDNQRTDNTITPNTAPRAASA